MANVTSAFISDRKGFLETKIVLVPEPQNPGNTGPRTFWFDEAGGVVSLKATAPGGTEKTTVNAYWLSWKSKNSTVLDVGNEADYFFTSQMTGCRFKVLTAGGKNPKVAHIAGDLSPSQRQKAEDKLLEPIEESARATGTSRRLSVSGSKAHEYTGQVDNKGQEDQGSAFVFGVKDPDNDWKFQAQIVKASLADEFKFKQSLKKGNVPRIAELFAFN